VKDFNLKDALAGKPVITRDGRPVKIAGYSEFNNSLIGWVGSGVYQWTSGGQNIADKNDLFMAPTERKEWVVRVERNNGNKFISGPFITEDEYKLYIQILSHGCTYTIHEITIHE
jgi:hypothetical protein